MSKNKTEIEMTEETKPFVKSQAHGGCAHGCSHGHGGHGENSLLDVFFKYYGILSEFVFGITKYFFYTLVLVLLPAVCDRFYFRYGIYPTENPECALKLSITCFFTLMAYWSHSLASKPRDPGFVKPAHFVKKHGSDDSKYQTCEKCNVLKVDGVHHCSVCGRCTYMMDHHCPWTNNCVGYLTLKPFLLFLFYVVCLTSWTFLLTYKIAWQRSMQHVSLFLAFVPALGFKEIFMAKFMTPEQVVRLKALNEADFKEEMSLENK